MADQPTTDRLIERFELIVNGPALFNALVTALELKIFTFLSDNPGSSLSDVRDFAELPEHQMRVLMQALCATELIEKRSGTYWNSAVAADLLASDGPGSWHDILFGWQQVYYPAFAEMTTALRQGTNTALARHPGTEPTLYQRLAHQPELERTFHASMAAFTRRSMDALVSNQEFGSVRHLLDVAGGDGTTASHLAARYPELIITVFDLPSVSKLAQQAAAASADRIRVHAGNFFTDDFPTGMDAVLFSHCLEIFSAEQIVQLLGKAYAALPSGGRLMIYGYNVSDDETRGLYAARLSLYLNVLATGAGMAYPAKDYEGWMREVGLHQVRTFTDLPYEHGLTVGVKA